MSLCWYSVWIRSKRTMCGWGGLGWFGCWRRLRTSWQSQNTVKRYWGQEVCSKASFPPSSWVGLCCQLSVVSCQTHQDKCFIPICTVKHEPQNNLVNNENFCQVWAADLMVVFYGQIPGADAVFMTWRTRETQIVLSVWLAGFIQWFLGKQAPP